MKTHTRTHGIDPVALTVPLYYASRVKRALTARPPATPAPTLTAFTPTGRTVRLRPPATADAAQWRDGRMRNQHLLEQFWPTVDASWADRHTNRQWLHECMTWRRRSRTGGGYSTVIEVDGEFAGQCNMEWIDNFNRTGEMGIWLDGRFAGQGVATTTVEAMLRHTFDALHLARVCAPTHVDNTPAQKVLIKAGFTLEATMHSYAATGELTPA